MRGVAYAREFARLVFQRLGAADYSAYDPSDYGFLTLTMALSCFVAGAMSDRVGPSFATASLASLCIVMSVGWSAWTWKLWSR